MHRHRDRIAHHPAPRHQLGVAGRAAGGSGPGLSPEDGRGGLPGAPGRALPRGSAARRPHRDPPPPGPTLDDFTKECFAEVLGAELREDAQSREDMLAFYAARKRVPPESNFKQALLPAGAEALRNPVGTAPGVWWEDPPAHSGARIVMLPGVP